MRLRLTQKLGFSYSLRLLGLGGLALLVSLFVLAFILLYRERELQNQRFVSLQKQLSPPLLEAARLRQRSLVRALLEGALDAHQLLGIRFASNEEGWSETVTRSGKPEAFPESAAGYRFVILDQRDNGILQALTIEVFAPLLPAPFALTRLEFIVPLLLGGCLFALGMRWQAETFLIGPLRRLRSRYTPLRISAVLAGESPVRPLDESKNEFDQIESSLLLLLQKLQNEQKDSRSAGEELARLRAKLQGEAETQRTLRTSHDSKLAALGEMAGGIAHEINNPLAILVGRAAQLRRVLSLSASISPQLEGILSSIENTVFRIQELVFELEIIASKPSQEERRPLALRAFLQKIAGLASERFMFQGLKLSIVCESDVEVLVRENELTQALLYLLENGSEAAAYSAAPWVRLVLGPIEEESVTLFVMDSGPGIPSDIRSKIFQPFFTTKDVGGGRGTGLSLAKSMIEANEGRVNFDFDASSTTLCIVLPRHRDQAQNAA